MNEQPTLFYEVAYAERLSRWLIFVKWLLVIPHLIVLGALYFALYFTTIIAWFGILFTGRYPRGLWNFAVMTLRWHANVTAYTYLQRDEYPPFGEGTYPTWFEFHYPDRMSRLLIFVKWLLIIPHAIVLYILNFILTLGLVIAWFAILFTARYPRGLFELVTDISRWSFRVTTYVLLLTDAYPPFSFSNDRPQALPQPNPYGSLPGQSPRW